MFSWLALGGVWISLLTLGLAATMLLYRPAMTDLTVLLVLYFGAPGALCFAGLVLWAHRKDASADPAIAAQKTQAKVAIALALLAAAIVYGLIIFSQKLEPAVPLSYWERGRGEGLPYSPLPLGEGRGEGLPFEPPRNDLYNLTEMMNITLNGEQLSIRDDVNIADLLAERKLLPVRVAVEVNEELVPRKRFAETPLRDGDRIEIVTFVGGG